VSSRAIPGLAATGSPVPGPARVRRTRGPQHALRAWNEAARAAGGVETQALFLDFDGTLAPIRRRPDLVHCSKRMRDVLTKLARHHGLWLGIVSGRRTRTLKRLIGVQGIHYCGAYGAESEGSTLKISRAAHRALFRMRKVLETELGKLAGVWTEDKGLSLAVHYRGARGDAVAAAEDVLRRALTQARPVLRIMAGRKSWEIVPREIPGKGAAVVRVMRSLPAGSVGIYIGDDAADEEAFAALPGGITIHVGLHGKTRARYFLRTPGEVLQWLVRFEEALP